MKTLTLLLLLSIAAAGLLERGHSPGTPLVTIGPLETPILPPRVRVTNDHADEIGLAYLALGTGELRDLGTLASSATQTFQLPEDVADLRIVAQSRAGGEQFVSGTIHAGGSTDIVLVIGRQVGESVLQVTELDLVRTR